MRSSTAAGQASTSKIKRACSAIQASSVAVRPWESTPAAALAASTQAMTRAACAGPAAPGGQSSTTCRWRR
eukprot:11904524-Alexandrium_andersonii.AAC.1